MSGAASLSQAYFAGLQAALAKAGICEPVLLIDKTRLNQNIDTLKGFLPRGMAYRIVAKSLPSEQLLVHVAKRARTDRLMSFNAAMVAQLLARLPDYDQLLGKPVPVAALAQMLGGLKPSQKKALSNVQWLVDTPERASQYGALARAQKLPLRINLEIDVGLHRGGMAPGEGLQAALDEIVNTPELSLSGLMGYEPHLAKLPKLAGWPARAKTATQKIYAQALAQSTATLGARHVKTMVRNMAGSPTFRLYKDTQLANELAAGSTLVKPSDFDTPLLKPFVPAAFIATPALKVENGVRVPGGEQAGDLLQTISPGTSVFTHGGYWMASAVYPKGLAPSPLMGRSSNQELLVGPAALARGKLAVDEFVFLRPHQSEAVFLQFPKLAIFEKGRIVDIWEPLPVSA
jgi:D-serine deaminase-like pyridoxal phosphate-dependent protein